jgi:site-specific DNA-cytosine methylase
MNKKINVLSLFDGISCGQIALERTGIPVNQYFASEIDRHAIKVTQHNYPQTIQLGSVVDIKAVDLPNIELIIGGSPCQGFSFMGKQLNFDDPRSKLFFEYTRLLNEVRAINPNVYFLLENVKMKKEFEEIINRELGVIPIKINSSLVSAHLRSRYYWTNIPNVSIPHDKNIKLNEILEYGYSEREKSVTLLASYGEKQASASGVRHYQKKRVGQLICDPASPTGYRKLTVKEACRLQTVPDNYLIDVMGVADKEKYRQLGNGWTVDVIAHIFTSLRTS